MKKPAWLEEWFKSELAAANFTVQPTELSAMPDWRYQDGAVRHKTGRFFNVVGTRWNNVEDAGQIIEQPLLEQREVGTLGFLWRAATKKSRPVPGPELLVQAKIEPGNVGGVQLAPTCQATASNLACVHGGQTPPGSVAFTSSDSTTIRESLQSEHGTRFLCKQNRNVLVQKNEAAENPPDISAHRWVAVADMLKLLSIDFLVNTDARSVLVSSPWRHLISRLPFTRDDSKFSQDLQKSYATELGDHVEKNLKDQITNYRAQVKSCRAVPLAELKGWKSDNKSIQHDSGQPFAINFIHTYSRSREVAAWDQPILKSSRPGLIELICGRRKGILHFMFKAQPEPGLLNRVELNPASTNIPNNAIIRLECNQSEEGGRFYQDINRYRVIDIGEIDSNKMQTSTFWLPLGSIQKLLLEGGWFTNEARSALSLLLTWL